MRESKSDFKIIVIGSYLTKAVNIEEDGKPNPLLNKWMPKLGVEVLEVLKLVIVELYFIKYRLEVVKAEMVSPKWAKSFWYHIFDAEMMDKEDYEGHGVGWILR